MGGREHAINVGRLFKPQNLATSDVLFPADHSPQSSPNSQQSRVRYSNAKYLWSHLLHTTKYVVKDQILFMCRMFPNDLPVNFGVGSLPKLKGLIKLTENLGKENELKEVRPILCPFASGGCQFLNQKAFYSALLLWGTSNVSGSTSFISSLPRLPPNCTKHFSLPELRVASFYIVVYPISASICALVCQIVIYLPIGILIHTVCAGQRGLSIVFFTQENSH